MGLMAGFLWFRRPSWRESLKWSLLPILGGLIVGLGPLLLWAARDPSFAYKAYFGKMDWGLVAGQNVAQANGIFDKFEVAFGQILPNLPKLFTMFTVHGGIRPWFFKLDPAPCHRPPRHAFLAAGWNGRLPGALPAASGFALLVSWWLLGLTPSLLANPQFCMDERRIMLNMPRNDDDCRGGAL